MLTYTAATLIGAARPVQLRIGRVAYRTRPVSAWCVLRAVSAVQSGDAAAQEAATRDVLAACYAPLRWYERWKPNPVRATLRLPGDLRSAVLAAVMRVAAESAPEPEDDTERLRRLQRAVTAPSGGPRPTLEIAALTCRVALGDRWWYAPDRWPTADGYVPHGVVWAEYVGLEAVAARRRLDMMLAAQAAQARNAPDIARRLLVQAYPQTRAVS